MTQRKRIEWEQACARWPELSPFVLLKLSMTWHGAVLSERALDRLQEPDYCFGKLEPFGIDFQGRPSGKVMPGAILLRDGTNVYINYGETYTDPYEIDWDPENGVFLLRDGAKVVDTLDFVPRPDFYGKVTSRGTPMEAVAEARAQKLIMTAFQKCRLWEGGDQCHFCAFFSGGKSLGAVDCEDVYETVREALGEPGRFQEIYVSGGTDFGGDPPFSQEVDRYIRVLQAAGRNFHGRFASQLMAPAYPKPVVRRLYEETGLTCYCPNIEVWDRRLFGILCPGKEKWIGHDAWIRRTIDAVEIFGKGNVCTQVVAGAELARPYGFETVDQALKSNLEACQFFAREGVICLTTIWRPHRASRLGFQPMPPLDYYIRLAKEFHEIRRSYGLHTVDDDYRHCGNHPDSDLERMDVPEAGKDIGDAAAIWVAENVGIPAAVHATGDAGGPAAICVTGDAGASALTSVPGDAGGSVPVRLTEGHKPTPEEQRTEKQKPEEQRPEKPKPEKPKPEKPKPEKQKPERRKPAEYTPGPLPEKVIRMLADPACRRYLVFSLEDQLEMEGDPAQISGGDRKGENREAPDRTMGDTEEDMQHSVENTVVFQIPSLTSPDGKILALALEEERSSLGRALVGAIWFGAGEPVSLRLEDGKETMEWEVIVYRCHLAGPLFARKYLELREKNPDVAIAAVWELR